MLNGEEAREREKRKEEKKGNTKRWEAKGKRRGRR
jgi:hypothetical protein